LNIVLVRVMGFAGLALGTSIAAILNAAVQVVMLRRELGGIQAARIAASFSKSLIAALVMAAAAFYADRWLLVAMPGSAIAIQAVRVGAAIALALAVLSGAAWLLRLHEFEEARAMVLKRFQRFRR
jgi:putative peptidoglycan lipid II flippase